MVFNTEVNAVIPSPCSMLRSAQVFRSLLIILQHWLMRRSRWNHSCWCFKHVISMVMNTVQGIMVHQCVKIFQARIFFKDCSLLLWDSLMLVPLPSTNYFIVYTLCLNIECSFIWAIVKTISPQWHISLVSRSLWGNSFYYFPHEHSIFVYYDKYLHWFMSFIFVQSFGTRLWTWGILKWHNKNRNNMFNLLYV